MVQRAVIAFKISVDIVDVDIVAGFDIVSGIVIVVIIVIIVIVVIVVIVVVIVVVVVVFVVVDVVALVCVCVCVCVHVHRAIVIEHCVCMCMYVRLTEQCVRTLHCCWLHHHRVKMARSWSVGRWFTKHVLT